MTKKKCELCRLPARLYCESDEASLCAGCDLKVHEANFLVARHFRRLLCKRCQCVTPWEACGARLGNTVTECDRCAAEADEIVISRGVANEVFDEFAESCDDNDEKEKDQVVSTMTASSSTGDVISSNSSTSAACTTASRSRSSTSTTIVMPLKRTYARV